jgi:hypothetical protein
MWTKAEYLAGRARLEARLADAQRALVDRPGLGLGGTRLMTADVAARLGLDPAESAETVGPGRSGGTTPSWMSSVA